MVCEGRDVEEVFKNQGIEEVCENQGIEKVCKNSWDSKYINVLALVKGEERYVFLYDDESRTETLKTLGRYASNPEFSFTWYDAAVLSQKIRQESQKIINENFKIDRFW